MITNRILNNFIKYKIKLLNRIIRYNNKDIKI